MKGLLADRAMGTLLGLAAGDALGAGYEFQGPVTEAPRLRGGGLGDWAPGEWTDDTQMAICVAEVTAGGTVDLEAIGKRFLGWYASRPPDVGVQTATVLGAARGSGDLPSVASDYFRDHPDGSAGNGSLMRTAPVALAHLGDDAAIARAARAVSGLTHADPLAGDACVLWCIAIDRAIRAGRVDGVRDGLPLLDPGTAEQWDRWLEEAESGPPGRFVQNGFVVTALQAAYAAVTHTPVPSEDPCRHLSDALETAVRTGHDTDTVAAIAGSLLGARWGASALPFVWRRRLHGWPGMRAGDLGRLAVLTVQNGRADDLGWPLEPSLVTAYGEPPLAVPLTDDPGLTVGNLAGLESADADAVVSLCRVGVEDVPADLDHHEVVLIDDPDANPNLAFCVADAADAVATLRQEGRTVFLHCAAGRSRTPTVAAAYLARHFGIPGPDALERVAADLPFIHPNPAFRGLLADL